MKAESLFNFLPDTYKEITGIMANGLKYVVISKQSVCIKIGKHIF